MSDEGECRTASATPGLLKTQFDWKIFWFRKETIVFLWIDQMNSAVLSILASFWTTTGYVVFPEIVQAVAVSSYYSDLF